MLVGVGVAAGAAGAPTGSADGLDLVPTPTAGVAPASSRLNRPRPVTARSGWDRVGVVRVADVAGLRAVAAAAARAPLPETPQVLLVGLSGGVTAMPWVHECPDLGAALQALDELCARGAGPVLVVSTERPSAATAAGLERLAGQAGWGGVALLADADRPGGSIGVRDGRLELAADLVVPVDDPGAFCASVDQPVLARPDAVAAPAAGPTGAELSTDAAVPTSTGSVVSGAAGGARVGVEVVVLGAVELQVAGGRVPVRARKALEALAYLALREGPVVGEDLQAVLWPDGLSKSRSLHDTLSRARRAVGDGADGRALLPPISETGDRYVLDRSVGTDYGRFRRLVADARQAEGAAAGAVWSAALALVRGEPLSGDGHDYGWAGPVVAQIAGEVAEAASAAAAWFVAAGELGEAERAVQAGLRAAPSDERLFRALMRVRDAQGSTAGVTAAYRQLVELMSDDGGGYEPHPETTALFEQLTRRCDVPTVR